MAQETKVKYTGEPWTKERCHCKHEACDQWFVSITGPDGRVSEEVADLIIQAPDCLRQRDAALDALEKVRRFLDGDAGSEGGGVDWKPIRVAIVAALAKAGR